MLDRGYMRFWGGYIVGVIQGLYRDYKGSIKGYIGVIRGYTGLEDCQHGLPVTATDQLLGLPLRNEYKALFRRFCAER